MFSSQNLEMIAELQPNNPKAHDSLFKWLISSFTREFFAHYFPQVNLGSYRFIDKEFISKYEALKESLKGDLFLILEVEIDGQYQAVAKLKDPLTADQLLLINQWVDFYKKIPARTF